MQRNYSTNQVSVALTQSVWQSIFMGRPSRLIVAASSVPNAAVFIANADMGNGNPGFAAVGASAAVVLKRADYGPLLGDEIWAMTLSVGISATFTEIFKVGS